MHRVAGTTIRSCAPLAAAAAAAVAVTALPVRAITTFNWSFTTNIPDQFGSGMFTIAESNPQANTSYEITGVSGTYNRGGVAYSISGLESESFLQWDGTNTSPIITDGAGITLTALSGEDGGLVNPYFSGGGFGPVDDLFTAGFNDASGTLQSTLLTLNNPGPGPAEVPGPLPLMGAGAAFAWSRRLRKRVASRPAFKL